MWKVNTPRYMMGAKCTTNWIKKKQWELELEDGKRLYGIGSGKTSYTYASFLYTDCTRCDRNTAMELAYMESSTGLITVNMGTHLATTS